MLRPRVRIPYAPRIKIGVRLKNLKLSGLTPIFYLFLTPQKHIIVSPNLPNLKYRNLSNWLYPIIRTNMILILKYLIKSNTLTITVVDMEAREIAEKEAEEVALREAEEKRLAEEAALREAEEKRLAEEAALKEAEEKRLAEEAAKAEAEKKAAEEAARKQAEAEKANLAAQETTRMYASSRLNIRSANNTNSEILGKLSVNDTVNVISTDGDWATILYNDNIAYVASSYLSSTKTTVQTESGTDEVGVQVWIPRTGSKYHSRSSCSGMKNPTQVSKSKAESLGYEPCKKCY